MKFLKFRESDTIVNCSFFYDTKVVIAQGFHLFPFRTEKLNLATPMVLRKRESR